MRRLLHVHSGNLYGGVETMLMTLARQREDCPDFEHHFALCFQGRLSRELASTAARVHSIGAVRVSRPLTIFHSRQAVRKLLLEEKFDGIIFHSAWSHAIFAPAARAAKVPVVVWIHGTTGGRHWTERWAGRSDPDLVVCNSHFTAGGAAEVYPRTPRKVLYCPVDLQRVSLLPSDRKAIRAEFDTAGNAVVIVQVSRIERWKGHLVHLEALSRLKTPADWICWFVGGPQRQQEEKYFQQLRTKAARLGISGRVRFLNERSDVPMLLKAADIYCQPNLGPEPFGITLVEALNAQLPVVATSMGGANEIIDETCGMLVRPGDADGIAGSLRRLIEDPSLRRRLGQGGPARAKKLCDPAARVKELSGILTGALSFTALNP